MAELTQQFSGRSLEEAISNATDTFGRGAEVLEAKRVRRGGVLGFMKRESYEVTARVLMSPPRGGDAPRDETRRAVASFDHALNDMIDEVDLREERQVLTQAPSRRARSDGGVRSRVANRFTEADMVPLAPEPARAATPRMVAARQGAAPRATVTPRSATQTPVRSSTTQNPSAGERQLTRSLNASAARPGSTNDTLPPPPSAKSSSSAATIDLREQSNGPAWSTERLRKLGVPEVVLELMPTGSLEGDVAWTIALEAAIRARLPETPTVPLAVHGYGDNAAVKMVESTINGYAIGELHLLDRVVPATPFELTLAIRACLSR